MRTTTPFLLSAVLLAATPCTAAAQEGIGELIAAELEKAPERDVPELWRRAASLRDVARSLGREDLDVTLDRVLAEEAPSSEAGALLLASARLFGPDVDAERVAAVLEPLIDSARDDYAVAAVGLLGDTQMRTLGSTRREEILARLTDAAQDGVRAPRVRLEAAGSLFGLGWGAERRTARKIMSAFLESEDAELRAAGAIALARTGAEVSGPLYDELRRLSRVPDERGRLATSYLEIEDAKRAAQRKIKRVEAYYEGRETDAASLPKSDLEQLQRIVAMIDQYHMEGEDVTYEELLEAAMDGMLRSLDEHSSYMSSTAYTRFEQELEAGYGGIGAYVGEDRDDGLFTITHPIYSGPAYKSGLLSDDKIVRIDEWSTVGEPVDDVIKRLKGRPGTAVRLYVWRRGMDPELIERPTEDMVIEVERASITIPPVKSQFLPGKVGMVALRDFSRVAAQELRKPLQEMLDQGMQAVILDLRNNSGGLLDQAVEVAGLFLPKGSVVVSTESRIASTETLKTEREPLIPADMPVVVLVNRFSASASEIVSGALQDHGRATLIGKRTFGKGSVQNLIGVLGMRDDVWRDENGNGRFDNWERITKDYNGNGEFDYAPRVKMTIARYRLPSGRSIHRERDKEGNEISKGGVEPDVDISGRRIEAWRVEALYDLRNRHVVRDYLDDLVARNAERADWLRERFYEIAENDRKDTSLYPDFELFFQGLDTPLARDDVRQLVRAEIRRRVQDVRGQEFPPGDFVEDLQLQEAIRVALGEVGSKPQDFVDYTAITASDVSGGQIAALGEAGLRDALEQIDAARNGDGRLSQETLDRLTELLEQRRSDGDER